MTVRSPVWVPDDVVPLNYLTVCLNRGYALAPYVTINDTSSPAMSVAAQQRMALLIQRLFWVLMRVMSKTSSPLTQSSSTHSMLEDKGEGVQRLSVVLGCCVET